MSKASRYLLTMMMFVSMAVTACSVKTKVLMGDTPGHYEPPKEIQVLTESPAQPYQIIATLICTGGPGTKHHACLMDMKEKAREIGANAIIPYQMGTKKIRWFYTVPYVEASALKFVSKDRQASAAPKALP